MMLLRSSSTPILSSLPEVTGNQQQKLLRTSSGAKHNQKITFPVDPSSFTWHSKHIRRVQSDDNLIATLLNEEAEMEPDKDSPVKFLEVMPTRIQRGKCKPMSKLEPIPSFSSSERYEKEGHEEEFDGMDDENITKEDEFSFPDMSDNGDNGREEDGGFGFFSFVNGRDNGGGVLEGLGGGLVQGSTPLYMALGLGIEPNNIATIEKTELDDEAIQRHYESLVKENPRNSLILRNFARYLYKRKRDFKKAEEYYSRAILEEPNDGEILSDYANLRWEVYGDIERAYDYFRRALQASPQNNDVLATYASFLWATEVSGDEKNTPK